MNLVTMILACSVYPNDSIVKAMVEVSSQNNPLVISGETFKTQPEALMKADTLKAAGTPFEIGLMQIPSFWLKGRPVTDNELLRPCKNMVLATQILNKMSDQCNGSVECALSMYKTDNKDAGLAYAQQIMQYAQEHPFVPPPPAPTNV